MDASTPPAGSRKRWVPRSESERAQSKQKMRASNPVQPVTRDTKYGPILVLMNVPFEAKKLISREHVSQAGHPVTAASAYVRYKGSSVDGSKQSPSLRHVFSFRPGLCAIDACDLHATCM